MAKKLGRAPSSPFPAWPSHRLPLQKRPGASIPCRPLLLHPAVDPPEPQARSVPSKTSWPALLAPPRLPSGPSAARCTPGRSTAPDKAGTAVSHSRAVRAPLPPRETDCRRSSTVQQYGGKDETCPFSTGGRTRRVQLVQGEGGGRRGFGRRTTAVPGAPRGLRRRRRRARSHLFFSLLRHLLLGAREEVPDLVGARGALFTELPTLVCLRIRGEQSGVELRCVSGGEGFSDAEHMSCLRDCFPSCGCRAAR